MQRDHMTKGSDCAARAGGAVVAHAVSPFALRRDLDVMIRVAFVDD